MDLRTRERLGAASGLIAAVLFGISFIIGISPSPPDMDAPAQEVADFVNTNHEALRVGYLLNTLAMLFFLWFLGSVRAGLRTSEGGAGRVSAIASGGGLVGAGFVILAQVFGATATLRAQEATQVVDPEITRTLIDLQLLSIGLGAAAFAVFFGAVAVAVLYEGGLPDWLGWLAGVAYVAALIGVVTIFTDSGVFAADGAFGFWARYAVFVVWIALASIALVTSAKVTRRRR
jgi:hypothetical protein